jgi:NAD(P)-dependent dehydrogenase (short-subunit alcohol dehydrogenase family)
MSPSRETQSDRTLHHPLAGKIALVTGGSRGIGAAIARRLSAGGARVAIVGRDLAALQAVAAELDGDPLVLTDDLSAPEGPVRTLNQVIDKLGSLDILVNSAGVARFGPSNALNTDDIEAVFDVNVRAPMLLSGAAAAKMAETGGGSIISISTALTVLGTPYSSLYSASKGAIDALTRALAAEWGSAGVRVNAIRPGVTRTEMVASITEDEALLAHYLRSVPLKRVGEPADIAATAYFLASDDGAYITGQIIDVAGGWSTTERSVVSVE